jgi:hypothetical protein
MHKCLMLLNPGKDGEEGVGANAQNATDKAKDAGVAGRERGRAFIPRDSGPIRNPRDRFNPIPRGSGLSITSEETDRETYPGVLRIFERFGTGNPGQSDDGHPFISHVGWQRGHTEYEDQDHPSTNEGGLAHGGGA